MNKIIAMQDTDLTGTWYFTKPLEFAERAFEELLERGGFSLRQEIEEGQYLLPIVESRCTYISSPGIRDEIRIASELENCSEHSFTMRYELYVGDKEVARVYLTHAVVCRITHKKKPVPTTIKKCLTQMGCKN